MPDTGLPWEIPYLDGTELVRDYPQASEDLAEAVAEALTAANVGIGTNVVQTIVSAPISVATNETAVDIPGLSVVITPTSATSKILVTFSIGKIDVDGNRNLGVLLARNGTLIGLGDAAGSRGRASFSGFVTSDNATLGAAFTFLDNPGTTSAITYKLQATSSGATTTFFNRGNQDGDAFTRYRTASTIIVAEVAA
jgi:hypothetical protein